MPSAADLSKVAGDRFSIVSTFPAAVVIFYIFGLVRAGAFTGPPHLDNIIAKDSQPSAVVVLLLAIAVFTAAVLLQPFQLGLVRLLEGYWGTGRVGSSLSEILTAPRRSWLARQRSAANKALAAPVLTGPLNKQIRALRDYQRELREQDRGRAVADRYPMGDERVMPTALGNALRSFEDSAGERYGLDTISAFRRLHPLMSPSLTKAYTTHRVQLDAAAGLCLAFVVITGVSIGAFVRTPLWLFVPAGTAVLTYLTYRGAMTSAVAMGRVVIAAFDLHRHDLLAALHYPLPPDPVLEYAFNTRLSEWLQGRYAYEDALDAPVKAPRRMFTPYAHNNATSRSEASGPDPREANSPSDAE